MALSPTRPVFREGQVLAAADLEAIGELARGRAERHAAFSHRPGIVTGLALEAEDASDAAGNSFQRIFVTPGLAIDSAGREILVTERSELDVRRFAATLGAGATATTDYPVLLRSRYAAGQATPASGGRCGTSAAQPIAEGADITVERPESVSADQVATGAPAATASPAEGAGAPLLLGFVRWDSVASQFAATIPSANGIGRTAAGINAATVAGIADRVLLQPGPSAPVGSLALEFDGAARLLKFGPLVGGGTVADPVFSVDGDGNVTASGTLSGRAAPGTMISASGIASDGLRLPLPPGVSEQQVSDGVATLAIMVAPNVDPADAPAAPAGAQWAALVQECRIDDDRRLLCRIAWMSLDFAAGAQGANLVSRPGSARYLVVATLAAGAA